MKLLNVRVYKSVTASGQIYFSLKTEDSRASDSSDSISGIAKNVLEEVTSFFKDNGKLVQANIDFAPYHEMEIPSGLSPRRCYSLSDKEKKLFWETYNNL